MSLYNTPALPASWRPIEIGITVSRSTTGIDYFKHAWCDQHCPIAFGKILFVAFHLIRPFHSVSTFCRSDDIGQFVTLWEYYTSQCRSSASHCTYVLYCAYAYSNLLLLLLQSSRDDTGLVLWFGPSWGAMESQSVGCSCFTDMSTVS